ncbi:MAG: cytochrome b [Alphaproteobacteria bacterium]|nr:cytochrome b [Alphaproteobacteria bacterium]
MKISKLFTSTTLLTSIVLLASTFITPALAAGHTHNSWRAPGDLDSWASIFILIASLMVAAFVNGRESRTRIIGTWLAALGCFGVVAWFGVYAIDTLDNPREHVLPVDAAKPILLQAQMLIAFVVGLALLGVARWQARRTDRLDIPTHNTPDNYGKVSRILHWTIAILIILLVPMGIFATMIPEGTSFRGYYYVTHKSLGFSVLILVFARLAWNIWGSRRPALATELKLWERRLAHTMHILLYVLMIGLPISGFMMSNFGGASSHFFFWDITPFFEKSIPTRDILGLMHKVVLPYLLYIFLGTHILGALKHQFIDKHENALRRMVS